MGGGYSIPDTQALTQWLDSHTVSLRCHHSTSSSTPVWCQHLMYSSTPGGTPCSDPTCSHPLILPSPQTGQGNCSGRGCTEPEDPCDDETLRVSNQLDSEVNSATRFAVPFSAVVSLPSCHSSQPIPRYRHIKQTPLPGSTVSETRTPPFESTVTFIIRSPSVSGGSTGRERPLGMHEISRLNLCAGRICSARCYLQLKQRA